MTKTTNNSTNLLVSQPTEIHLIILSYLRARELSSLHQTCKCFTDRSLISSVILEASVSTYPHDLTDGFDHMVDGSPAPRDNNGHFTNFEPLRCMETLVVARLLSRPDPPFHERENSYYVSKSWCKSALKWLEYEHKKKQEHYFNNHNNNGLASKRSSKKKSKKKGKGSRHSQLKNKVQPPVNNINHDICCTHGDLRHCSSKSARARRRIMDKQAWKILRKLYPDSVQLNALQTECVQCAMEEEMRRKNKEVKEEEEKEKRRKPLACPLIRGFYMRGNKGVPLHALRSFSTSTEEDSKIPSSSSKDVFCHPISSSTQCCPLIPGIYYTIPRAWCHKFRRYLKSGGERPSCPDGSSLLCDAHTLPVVPNHLEAYLRGEVPGLLSSSSDITTNNNSRRSGSFDGNRYIPGLTNNNNNVLSPDHNNIRAINSNINRSLLSDTEDSFIAAGVAGIAGMMGSDDDWATAVEMQRLAMLQIEEQNNRNNNNREQEGGNSHTNTPQTPRAITRSSSNNNVVAAAVAAIASPSVATVASPMVESNNDRLDRENRVVVEILTDEELTALENYWPDIRSSFLMKFAVTYEDTSTTTSSYYEEEEKINNITWSTSPCQSCYDGNFQDHCHVAKYNSKTSRTRRWVRRTRR